MTTLSKSDLPAITDNDANPLYATDQAGNATFDADGSVAGAVTSLVVGLSWEEKNAEGNKRVGKRIERWARKQRGELATTPSDLDLGALFFVGDKPTKYIGFDNFQPFKDEGEAGAARCVDHSGDNQTGAGDGDDEQITFNLNLIPRRFTKILIVAGAFKPGSDVEATTDMMATIYDKSDGTATPVAVLEPSLLESRHILGVASLERVSIGSQSVWTLTKADDIAFNIHQGDIKSLLRAAMNSLGV